MALQRQHAPQGIRSPPASRGITTISTDFYCRRISKWISHLFVTYGPEVSIRRTAFAQLVCYDRSLRARFLELIRK